VSARKTVIGDRFVDVPGIHPDTLRGLGQEGMKFEKMTGTQKMYLSKVLANPSRDYLVRAQTGTGKTLGFMIPVLQRIVDNRRPDSVQAIILSPSRELAMQTAREAVRLSQFHRPAIGVSLLIGGIPKKKDDAELRKKRPAIIVATPGRLKDHIDGSKGFAESIRSTVIVLVLDEADRLLDMGFEVVVRQIAAALPPADVSERGRQTLMFSATVPDKVKSVAMSFSRPGKLDFLDSGGETMNTNNNIEQRIAILKGPQLYRFLLRSIKEHIATRERPGSHRIIVFVSTAKMAESLSLLMRKVGYPETGEIHSRLNQPARTRAELAFSRNEGSIIVASDVISRGIDFPDVSLVIQMGIPSSAEQYEHRVGRTARGGKTGIALAMYCEDEVVAVKKLGIDKIPQVPAETTSDSYLANPRLDALVEDIRTNRDADLKSKLCRSFVSTLGFYNSNTKMLGWSREQLVPNVASRFASLGLPLGACVVDPKTAKKMRIVM
jgi:ATP-dependent RNA helicase MSS116